MVNQLKNGIFSYWKNLRFHPEEEKNDPAFAQALAKPGAIFMWMTLSAQLTGCMRL